jgi:hypothetical protein
MNHVPRMNVPASLLSQKKGYWVHFYSEKKEEQLWDVVRLFSSLMFSFLLQQICLSFMYLKMISHNDPLSPCVYQSLTLIGLQNQRL